MAPRDSSASFASHTAEAGEAEKEAEVLGYVVHSLPTLLQIRGAAATVSFPTSLRLPGAFVGQDSVNCCTSRCPKFPTTSRREASYTALFSRGT